MVVGRIRETVLVYIDGEVAEWFKALVLKTSVARATVGSNPTFSATYLG